MKQTFRIHNESSKSTVAAIVQRIPIDKVSVVTIEPETKKRTRDQNSMNWAGMLEDFSNQAKLSERHFSAAVWHEYLKEKFLPECYKEGETLKDYVKWIEMPGGHLKMVGSTTKLTTKGFSDYLEKCYAFGCELDIRFTTVRYSESI
jgi:hypothetical protein